MDWYLHLPSVVVLSEVVVGDGDIGGGADNIHQPISASREVAMAIHIFLLAKTEIASQSVLPRLPTFEVELMILPGPVGLMSWMAIPW